MERNAQPIPMHSVSASLIEFSKELNDSEVRALQGMLVFILDAIDRVAYTHSAEDLLSDSEQDIVESLRQAKGATEL